MNLKGVPLYLVHYHALFKFRIEKQPEFLLSLSGCLTQTHAQRSACTCQSPAQKTFSSCPVPVGRNPNSLWSQNAQRAALFSNTLWAFPLFLHALALLDISYFMEFVKLPCNLDRSYSPFGSQLACPSCGKSLLIHRSMQSSAFTLFLLLRLVHPSLLLIKRSLASYLCSL